MSLRPILLAIVGDSAAGKSTLGAGISSLLGDERVTVVTTDDYHKHNRKARRELRISALHPDCNDLDLLGEHLDRLASGTPVRKAPYNHSTGDFDAPREIAPSEFLIVEGLLGLYSPALRDHYDLTVYLDTPEPLRHRWKVSRDTAKRGYSQGQVQDLLERREQVSARYIRPQRDHADMVVRFRPGPKAIDDTMLHATVAMRNQVRHPALTAVIEESPLAAPRLQLRKQGEGAVIEIDGRIADEEAAQAERALMRQRPELRQLLQRHTGQFMSNGTQRHSNALGLAQLLIAYPVISAKIARGDTV
ncbi:MAG: phosphoribulokinase [Gemmatimonadaceae bacterium]|nr:phosphoribulokinase [Gemmatimonadaceae bacterium]